MCVFEKTTKIILICGFRYSGVALHKRENPQEQMIVYKMQHISAQISIRPILASAIESILKLNDKAQE